MTSRGICMEQSLERSAKLSLDVLKRAKRRKVNWPDECNMQKFRAQDRGLYNNEDENIPLEEAEAERKRLDAAFSTMMEFMAHTTEQCEQYYHYKPFSECDKNEVNHVCRYHSRNLASTSQKPSSPSKQETFSIFPLSSTGGRSNSKDVVIEVTPGTYSVSARSHGLRHRTQLVNITPGQSVDVVFTT
ncbi:A-kinase-interacting protein 1 isoform X1 [Pleurodeles waltl]